MMFHSTQMRTYGQMKLFFAYVVWVIIAQTQSIDIVAVKW